MSNAPESIPFCGIRYDHPHLVITVLIDFKGRPYKPWGATGGEISYVDEHAYRTFYVRCDQIFTLETREGHILIYAQGSKVEIPLWNYEAFSPTYGKWNRKAIKECSELITKALIQASTSMDFTPESRSYTVPVIDAQALENDD